MILIGPDRTPLGPRGLPVGVRDLPPHDYSVESLPNLNDRGPTPKNLDVES